MAGAPRHFGGQLCPISELRAWVLWMPPCANYFASRQAWLPWVGYGLQFLSRRSARWTAPEGFRFALGSEVTIATSAPGHTQTLDPSMSNSIE